MRSWWNTVLHSNNIIMTIRPNSPSLPTWLSVQLSGSEIAYLIPFLERNSLYFCSVFFSTKYPYEVAPTTLVVVRLKSGLFLTRRLAVCITAVLMIVEERTRTMTTSWLFCTEKFHPTSYRKEFFLLCDNWQVTKGGEVVACAIWAKKMRTSFKGH